MHAIVRTFVAGFTHLVCLDKVYVPLCLCLCVSVGVVSVRVCARVCESVCVSTAGLSEFLTPRSKVPAHWSAFLLLSNVKTSSSSLRERHTYIIVEPFCGFETAVSDTKSASKYSELLASNPRVRFSRYVLAPLVGKL